MADASVCPVCGNRQFELKYEVVFEYTYFLDGDAPGFRNNAKFKSYLYDERVQKAGRQFIECCGCHTQTPCYFEDGTVSSDCLNRILQEAAQ